MNNELIRVEKFSAYLSLAFSYARNDIGRLEGISQEAWDGLGGILSRLQNEIVSVYNLAQGDGEQEATR